MKRFNNAGITLVELICAVALLSVVGLAAMSMMITVTRMNHTVALKQKQDREAELVYTTLRSQLEQNSVVVSLNAAPAAIAEQDEESTARAIWSPVLQSDGKVHLVLTIGESERIMAQDLRAENGFTIEAPVAGSVKITLCFANGNEYEWVLTPRIAAWS